MSVNLDISAALDTHLNSMSGVPSLVAWENLNVTPVVGTLWLRATNLQGDTVALTQGLTAGLDATVGVYQIDVFAEAGQGKNEAVVMSDTITDRFKMDTELTYNSRLVRITQVNRGIGRNDGNGYYHIPINIVYQAQTLRR